MELVASARVTPGADISARIIHLEQPSDWPIEEALRLEKMQVVGRITERFERVPPGPWSEPPSTAVIVPIPSSKPHECAGLMIAGISARLTLDDYYRDFFDLVKTQIASALSHARSYEEERKRAEALAELDRGQDYLLQQYQSRVSHAVVPDAGTSRRCAP